MYAPIGLLFNGPARRSKLIEQGRNQVVQARMMGEFAVKMGRNEVEKRAKEIDGPVGDVLRTVGLVPPAEPKPANTPTAANPTAERAADAPADEPAEKPAAPAAKPATKKPAAKKRTTKKAATKKRTAKKAAATAKPAGDVPAVDSLAITDYESLSASQVVSRLRGLDDEQLDAIAAYEGAHRGRKTILNKVTQLQKR